MEVTRVNFSRVLPQLLADIASATFVAFDLEHTGLTAHSRLKNASTDTLQHRYLKMRENTQSFYPLQFGLCTFHQVADRFLAKPYSIYLFPHSKSGVDRYFLMQSSSIAFLSTYNFDFNKAFLHGVNFLNSYDRYLLNSKHSKEDAAVSHLMRAAYLMIKDKVERLFTGETLMIDAGFMSSREVEYITKELLREKGLKVTKDKHDSGWTLKVETPEEVEEQDFSKVVLAMHGKPLVGHNMALDSLQMYDKFIDPLPVSLNAFRESFAKAFPEVYDTKHIVQSSSVLQQAYQATQNSSLQHCYSKLGSLEHRFTTPIEPQSPVTIADHDAAYDAYCTGVLLVRTAQLLGLDAKSFMEGIGQYKNCIPISGRRTSLTLPSGRADKPCEDIFEVRSIPLTLSRDALQEHLTALYGPVALYKPHWTSEAMIVCPSSPVSRAKMVAEVKDQIVLDTAVGQAWLSPYKEDSPIHSP
jgi:hypothetical protein